MTLAQQADALLATVGVRTLPEVTVVRVCGDDARAWLNGQLTNDLREAHPGAASYALQVDLRGRVVTDLWVLDRGAELALLLPAARVGRTLEIFDGYIVMEDVDIEPQPDVRVLSAQGPRAAEVLSQGPDTFPVNRLGPTGWERLVPAAEVDEALERAVSRATALGGRAVTVEGWELARLRRGIPSAERELREEAYPQEAGLERTAVSFDKGCYVGQEPVVMLQHRGKPPRRLVQLSVEGETPPPAGAPVAAVGGATVGHVTSSVAEPSAPGSCLALAYVRRAQAIAAAELEIEGRRARVRSIVGG